MPSPRRFSMLSATVAVFALAFLGQVAAPERVGATPVATSAANYQAYQRVFPDPQGCRQGEPGASPWAEGAVCATDFIQYAEMVAGLEFLETINPADFTGMYPEGGRPFGEFVELQRLDEDYADILDVANGEGMSAGLPTNDLQRAKVPLYLAKVTDSASDIPEADREHFVFGLSLHGIEKAGAEGGIRAIEDLVTWAATEPDRPLSETEPARSVSVGEALRRSVVYFAFANPDGWLRGDTSNGGVFYQRYNGNGVDINRDWPSQGFTFRPYTPLSEPESRSFAKVLESIRDTWTGGNDLHGQLIDRAFSFTLIGGQKRSFDKNEEAVRVMRRIWADQERRLSWSPLIKPNSAPPSCVQAGVPPAVQPDAGCDPSPAVYADQWGTIWDTIDYTVTGAFGDWVDSPLGLDALGLDNEMSLSHLANCGTGKCFEQQVEQLHVDGNKGLIYAQINLQLQETDAVYRQPGRVAYVVNPLRVSNPGSQAATEGLQDLPAQEDTSGTITQPPNTPFQFEVQGPDDGVYNGGFTVNVTFTNVQGVSAGALAGVVVERRRGEEPTPAGDDWTPVNSDYNSGNTYLQGGMTVNVNAPDPGAYRVRLDGSVPPGAHAVQVDFTSALSWPDPGQLPYDVANTDFFAEMDAFTLDGYGFTPVTVDDVLAGDVDLDAFDTLVLADRFMPGWSEDVPPPPPGPKQDDMTGTVATGAPGAGSRNAGTSAFFEFDIAADANNGGMTALVEPTTPADLDLYLQRQLEDGSYSGDVATGASSSLTDETLVLPEPRPGHYRLEIHNWAGPAGNPTDVTISFADPQAYEPEPRLFSDDQRTAYVERLEQFADAGGNLLLTDAAMDLLRYMQASDGSGVLVPDEESEDGSLRRRVEALPVYAGHVEFTDCTADGCGEEQGPTYARNDLAKEINQPGAAEGANNRHQTAEPVPTGYAIQNPSGSDLNSHPNWVVDRQAWEDAGGSVVGQSGDLAGVSLGELPYGQGVVRVIGSLLPKPTEEFDHPFGLAAYSVTYTGYQLLDNALQYVRPAGTWRLAGRDRFETSAEVAYHHWNTVESVVIASADDFVDALSAVPLAKYLDAPLLLTPSDKLDPSVYEYLLTRNPSPTTAYVIGGEAAVSPQVIEDLERLRIPAEGIRRVSGSNRYQTSIEVSRVLAEVTGEQATRAVIATGERFPDVLAVGPIAANYGPDRSPVPLLLTEIERLPEEVGAYLTEAGITETLIAGGTAAVSENVAEQLPSPTRVGGRERTETAALLADLLAELTGEPATEATLATADNFPDAMSVGSPGGRDGIPTLLVYPEGLDATPPTSTWLEEHNLRQVYIAGGYAVMPQELAGDVEELTGRTPAPTG